MDATRALDGMHSGATFQEDHHMNPQEPQSDFSTSTSSDLGSQDDSNQPPLNSARLASTNATIDEASLDEADHQSITRSSTPEMFATAGGVSLSQQTANSDDAPLSPRSDQDIQDEMQIDDDQENEEPPQIQFPNYMMYPSEYTEDIYLYRPGGHHPVHLGDILDGRFEVVHKLGFGGFSTVWLCLDTTTHKWRAIKIIRADDSTEDMPELDFAKEAKERGELDPAMWETHPISLPLEHFWVEGPNGRHLCEVLLVHGPSVEDQQMTRVRDGGLATLNDMLFQLATRVKYLHDNGICHGDLTTRNILFRLRDTSHIGKQEMLDLLGEPELEQVYASDVDPAPMAPRYKVAPVTTTALCRLGTVDRLVITDFGESFKPAEEDVQWSGIPLQFAAPEAVFRCKPQLPSDIWSLACDILLLTTKVGLVDPVRNTCTYVALLEAALGPLPEPYRTAHIEQLKEALEESGKDWKDYVGSGNKGNSQAYIPEDKDSDNSLGIVSEPKLYKSIKSNYDEWATKYGYENPIHILLARSGDSGAAGTATFEPHPDVMQLPDEEIQLLGDLLSKMLRYDPEERLDIDGVLRHEWFTKHRDSMDRSLIDHHSLQVSPDLQAEPIAEPTTSTISESASAPIVQSTPNQASAPGQASPRSLRVPVIQSTDLEMMGSLLDHDAGSRVPTGSTETVLRYFCVGFALVVLIPALYVYIMLLLIIPLFMRIAQRAWYS
ncbi:kinase-like domain-containing protein [Hypoxylon rubiginosum]|uniref:Kinase-like domain-containing protein n=1 Tax=Hypoxylon rubiginosum TaxID=110542 RepID=A0ACC0CYR6_9PEZI|nr:kinase-like domain-containing protein [Hypoxylon rubiginosum]